VGKRRVAWSVLPETPLFDLDTARREAAHLLQVSIDETDPTFRGAMILLAGIAVGRNAVRMAQFLGYPRQEVVSATMRLRHCGRWPTKGCLAHWGDLTKPEDSLLVAGRVTCRRGKWTAGPTFGTSLYAHGKS
jgi:hypothetical protein